MRCHAWLILLIAYGAALAAPRPTLPPEERTNGRHTLAAMEVVHLQAKSRVALLVNDREQPLSTATWVGVEGYFITKASEVPELEKAHVHFGDHQTAPIREIQRLPDHDLVLAQAIGVHGVTPVLFDRPAQTLPYGQWLSAPARGGQELKIGVVSARSRRIPGQGAAMGVRMDEKPVPGGGVRVIGIAEDSPAAAAGLQQGDILLELGGEVLAEFKRVNEIIRGRQPGEQVAVRYRRAGKVQSVQLRLASRTKILQNWEGEDFANGGISIRTDNFARVIQHDVPLHPLDMGSPLFDLEGRALGINISRVDRVTTFALPADVFWKDLQPLLEADRHPPKAQRP